MFFFITSTTYTSRVQGSAVKNVVCEACGESYSYLLFREAIGVDSACIFLSMARKKATEKAHANLGKMLATEHDDVPCSMCGHHQSTLIASIRDRSYAGLRNLGDAFFLFAAAALGIMLAIMGIAVGGQGKEWPDLTTVAQCLAAVLVIAAPGFLLRGFRSLLLLTHRPKNRMPSQYRSV